MYELNNLPNYAELKAFGERYGNPDVEGLQIWMAWASASHHMLSAYEAHLQRTIGVSRTQFFVLMLLVRYPQGRSVGQLAEGVSVTSQTMTRMVDRMLREKLCTRAVDPEDARTRVIQIAPAGQAIVDKGVPLNYVWVAKIMSHFDEEDRRMIGRLLSKLKLAGFEPAGTRSD